MRRVGDARVVAGALHTADGDVLPRRHLVAHEVLKDDADLAVQLLERVLAQVPAVEQDLADGRVVKPRDQLDDSGLTLAVLADERDALARPQVEVEVAQHGAVRARVGERHVAELEALADRRRRVKAAGVRVHGRLHLKEGDQVGEEERLVGDAGDGREDLLQVGARLLNGCGEKRELADAVTAAHRA